MTGTDEFEAMAEALACHPDYRVLRRLKDRDSYAGEPAAGAATGLILDTETTGLESTDRVLQLGMLRFEFDSATGAAGRIVDSYEGLEDPGIRIAPTAAAVHGITAEMVRGKRFDDAAVKRMSSGVSLVIAHNARFDRPMIEKRYPIFAHLNWACSYQEIDWKAAGFGAASLEYLAYRHGFFYDAHGAAADCRALLEILQQTMPGRQRFMKQMLGAVGAIEERIWALNAPFDRKDLLKARGYRWNADNPKSWWVSVSRANSRDELQWLLANVYQAKSATVRIDVIDATSRYSNRLTDSKTRRISALP